MAKSPKAAANTLTIDLFGEVGFEITSMQVKQQLDFAENRPIEVRLNSPGGSVVEGMAIYSMLRAHGGKVTTINMGICASMAAIIFLAGDKRIMNQGTTLMVHRASGGGFGNSEDLTKAAEMLDKMDESLLSIIVDRTGQDIKAVTKQVEAETWFTAEEALANGYATKVEGLKAVAIADPKALMANAPQWVRESLIAGANVMDEQQSGAQEGTVREAQGDTQGQAEGQLDEMKATAEQFAALEAEFTALKAIIKVQNEQLKAATEALQAQANAAKDAEKVAKETVVAQAAEAHQLCAMAAVDRFTAEGKISPAMRLQALAACGSTAETLKAAVSLWEVAPKILGEPKKIEAPKGTYQLNEFQLRLCAQTGMKPEDFAKSFVEING